MFGEGNFAFGIESFVGGNNALAAWNNGSTDASGSFVYSFTPPPPSGNPDSVTVAPPLRANNNGSLNIGRNTSAQMNGRGALGKGSMILGGVNNHIPTNSSDNVILGGNGLSARAGENFQTYVENLNINSIPINSDTLTQVLVRDPLNGQVKYRNASSFSSIPISLGSPPSSSNDIGMVGEVRWTTNYIYVCVAANTWVRAALSSW
ncbi:MAG: hypothetical protein JST74_11025 [Bacteroidetes bacterium]|nr:hypothetical protein [Bacteroidota bacterium]